MKEKSPFGLAPGQSRSLIFKVLMRSSVSLSLSLKIYYSVKSSSSLLRSPVINYVIPYRTMEEPHKFTFLLPSGTLSYAILRPPSRKVRNEISSSEALPVLLNLHGSGLDANSHRVRHMLDSVPDLYAWVLFPTGGTTWSGDDWRMFLTRACYIRRAKIRSDTWGFSDVEAAINAIPEWVKIVEWKGPQVDIDKWLVSGHSNGGEWKASSLGSIG